MARTERRVVTVLFADLVGFTALAGELDPEDVALVQDRYFAGARAAVAAAGGQVEKFVGDAVMAVFGVPDVHDDDAVRAVRAGLAIVDVVAWVSADLDGSATLQVRVGVNTGEVVVTFDEDGAGSWRLAGDAVNLAARFQTAADPGSVLVGADTALAVAPAFATEPAGNLALKGKTGTVAAWRIGEARPVPSREWALHGLHAPTLGRGAELARLESARRRAAGGHAEAVLVVAPPGVGKTRLVVDYRTRAQAAGSPAWSATGADQGPSPYEPVAQLLREALALPPGGDDSEPLRDRLRARLAAHGLTGPRAELSVDHTLALLGGPPAGDGAEPADLWTSWTAVLDAEPAGGPTVWVVEDVHLASPDLRAFLASAIAQPHRAGRLVVATARPSLLASGAGSELGPVDVVNLEPLGQEDACRLVGSLVGDGVLPPDLATSVAEASGGNPLFVEELLRSWVQAGALRRTDAGAWELAGGSDLTVPSTVRAIYLGQLLALPGEPRTVVETGSVPGTTFPAGALPVLGVDEPGTALDFLTGWGLLAGPHPDTVGTASYTYRHALLRDAAYGALPRARRTQLHARFADWVAATVPVEQAAEIVGLHLLTAFEDASPLGPGTGGGPGRAELAERAAAWLERAGELSLGSGPNRAAELFSLAVQLTDPERAGDGVRRQLRLAEALRRSGRLQDAVTVFGEAGAVAGTAAAVADAALGYEDALFESRLPRSTWGAAGVALLERALADEAHGPATRARLLAALGRALVYGGDRARGVEVSARALETARRSGDDGAVAYARMGLRASQSSPEQLPERLADAAELVAAAARAGDVECELEGVRLHFVDLLEAGDVAAADAAQRRAEDAINELRRPLYLWYPAMWRAMRALFAGDFAAAERLVEAFREEGARWRYRDVELVHAVQLVQLAVDRGDPERAEPVLAGVAAGAPERFAPVTSFLCTRVGRLDEAQALLDLVAADDFAAIPDDQSRAYVLAMCADAADALGDVDAARGLVGRLEPWAGHNVVLGSGAVCLGSGSLFLGLAARTAGDRARAVGLFEAAAAGNTAMGARPAAVRAGLELARTLLASGRAGDAVPLARRLRSDAAALGMAGAVAQLDEVEAAA